MRHPKKIRKEVSKLYKHFFNGNGKECIADLIPVYFLADCKAEILWNGFNKEETIAAMQMLSFLHNKFQRRY